MNTYKDRSLCQGVNLSKMSGPGKVWIVILRGFFSFGIQFFVPRIIMAIMKNKCSKTKYPSSKPIKQITYLVITV